MDNIPPSSLQRIYRIPTRVLKQLRSRPFTQAFTVTEIGHVSSQSSLPPEESKRHDANLLVFLARGEAELTLARKSFKLNSKQVALIPAKTRYSWASLSKTPCSQYWIKFESAGAQELLTWTALSSSAPVVNCAANENLKRHFNAILNALDQGYTEHTSLQLSLALIKILISLHENPLDRGDNHSRHRIESAMNLMREHVSNPQTLETYAKKAGYSTTQFSHLFRQHTGTSPINYLNELRIQRAAELLKNTDHSIKHIAHQLGFEDPLYFSRSFRKCVGVSPRAYRTR